MTVALTFTALALASMVAYAALWAAHRKDQWNGESVDRLDAITVLRIMVLLSAEVFTGSVLLKGITIGAAWAVVIGALMAVAIMAIAVILEP